MRTDYVVGFAFDTEDRVALIRKNRPEWQRGRLNGIGGHREDKESPRDAMMREFAEETGQVLFDWKCFVYMEYQQGNGDQVFIWFFRILNLDPDVLDSLESVTDEQVIVHDWQSVINGSRGQIIANLSWLIPLAAYETDIYDPIHVRSQEEAILA